MTNIGGTARLVVLGLVSLLFSRTSIAEISADSYFSLGLNHHNNLLFTPDSRLEANSVDAEFGGEFTASRRDEKSILHLKADGWLRFRRFDEDSIDDLHEYHLHVQPSFARGQSALSLIASHDNAWIFGSDLGDIRVPALIERTRQKIKPSFTHFFNPERALELSAGFHDTQYDEPAPTPIVDADERVIAITLNDTNHEAVSWTARLSYSDWESDPGTITQFGRPKTGNDTEISSLRLEIEWSGHPSFADSASIMLGIVSSDVSGTEPRATFVGVTPGGGLVFLLNRKDISEESNTLLFDLRTQHKLFDHGDLRLAVGRDRYPDSTGSLRDRNRAEAEFQWQDPGRFTFVMTGFALFTEENEKSDRPEFDDYLIRSSIKWPLGKHAHLSINGERRIRISPVSDRITSNKLGLQIRLDL